MKAYELVKFMENSEKAVFSINDIAKIIGKNKRYAVLFMDRLKRKGLVARIERDKYILSSIDPFSLASNVVYPSYVSFFSGIRYYNLTTQIPVYLAVAVLKQRKGLKFGGYKIQFIKIKSGMFFGYTRELIGKKHVFVAEKEKVILDCLYLPEYCSIADTYYALQECLNEIDLEKVVRYGKQIGSSAVLKRLGYLLETLGIDIYPKIKGWINKKYDKLNPSMAFGGKKNKKWMLVENEVLDD